MENLGEIEGRHFVFSDVELDTVNQPEGIDLKLEEMTPELVNKIKKSRFVTIKKDALRSMIDNDVGDIYDILADAMKLIEFNLNVTALLAKEVFSEEKLSGQDKEDCMNHVSRFHPLMTSDEMTLRMDYTNTANELSKILTRYSNTQKLVRDEYVEDLKRYGFWE